MGSKNRLKIFWTLTLNLQVVYLFATAIQIRLEQDRKDCRDMGMARTQQARTESMLEEEMEVGRCNQKCIRVVVSTTTTNHHH
jgi:hypothetical protein